MKLDTQPASDHPTTDLLQLLNLSFENYLVPVHFDLSQFLTMLRKDNIDLNASRVLLADGIPSGIALIARRGWTSRLAAMGIARDMRGKSAGAWLMEGLIREARERNDREMVLEVIEQNEAAVHLYQKCGFQTVRRLIGLIHREAVRGAKSDLQEIDLREMGRLILQYGWQNLPWQLSGETIALFTPPARAFKKGGAYIAVSNPQVEHVVIWSLLVEPNARGKGLAEGILHQIMANYEGKTWHVPAIWPGEFESIFETAGFELEDLSQWQMRLSL